MADDAPLLARWTSARDADAFAELARRHAGMVYGTCRRVLGDHHLAEDVAQDCLLELARKAAAVRSSVAGFLHAVALARARDRLREVRARHRREAAAAAPTGPAEEPTWAELAPLVDEAVAALPEPERVPLLLHYFSGRSHAEIAAELGCDRATVTRRIARGIDALRARFHSRAPSAVALAAMCARHGPVEAPPALLASATKIALSGVGAPAAAGAASLAKPAVAALLAAACVAGGVTLARRPRAAPPLWRDACEDLSAWGPEPFAGEAGPYAPLSASPERALVHGGAQALRVSTPEPRDRDFGASYRSFARAIRVPAGATRLRAWVRPVSASPGASFYLRLRGASEIWEREVRIADLSAGWQPVDLDLRHPGGWWHRGVDDTQRVGCPPVRPEAVTHLVLAASGGACDVVVDDLELTTP